MEQGGLIGLYVAIFALAILADLGLILIWRRRRQRRDRPQESVPPAAPVTNEPPAPTPVPESLSPAVFFPAPPDVRQLPAWIAAHWREALVALALLILLGYVWAVTPRNLLPPSTPGPVEPAPLAGLGRVFRFASDHSHTWVLLWLVVNGIALAGLCLIGRRTDRWPQVVRAATLLGSLALGLEGELLLLDDNLVVGLILCGLALIFFGVWLTLRWPSLPREPAPKRRMGWQEAFLLILVLALTTFARFHALPRIPYGIEGDESKWTIEVVSVMLDGQHAVESRYHYATEPVSFYMQVPFHRIFGPGILSARIAVASYSVLATLFFYWLVRQTLGPSVALLATTFLAVSLADVSASRLALVEAHVKIWAVAGLAFLAHGLGTRRAVYSFVGGVALALGLLTYETFAPVVAVAVIWAVVSLAVRRAAAKEWVAQLTALLLPILIGTPFVVEYLAGRTSYYGMYGASGSAFADHFAQTVQNFWRQNYRDFLFNRPGPIINGALVPFLALGFILALARFRRPGYALSVLWFALLFFPVPILTGAIFVRVFYPGFPAAYVLIALAVLLVGRETVAALPAAFRPALTALFGLGLAGLIGWNLYLYFNEVQDPYDRLLRRELSDTVTQALAPDRLVYAPYVDEKSDPVWYERWLYLLEARRKMSREQIDQHIWIGTYDELLPAISHEGIYFDSLAFVVNHSLLERSAAEAQIATVETLQRCLGAHLERQGPWISLYVADAPDVWAARCAAPRVQLTGPFPPDPQPVQPFRLEWWMEDASGPAEAHLDCRQLRPNTVAIEAEDMDRNEGWEEYRHIATDFRGRGYLAEQAELSNAHTSITLDAADTYTLWARTYRRAHALHSLYLSVDGQTHALVHGASDPLDQWTWVRVASFPLGAGNHTVRMATLPPGTDAPTEEEVEKARQMQRHEPEPWAVFVDALLLSADPAFDPPTESEWLSFLESHDDVPAHVSSGSFQVDGGEPGNYRCWVTLFDGERLVDWDGEPGARSNEVDFVIH